MAVERGLFSLNLALMEPYLHNYRQKNPGPCPRNVLEAKPWSSVLRFAVASRLSLREAARKPLFDERLLKQGLRESRASRQPLIKVLARCQLSSVVLEDRRA